jgi:hypothetical protein
MCRAQVINRLVRVQFGRSNLVYRRALYARRYTTLLRALLRINSWPTLGSFCWFARERKKAQTAEFSTDVSESSSFCLFIENDKSWSFRLRPPTGSRRRILQLLNSCNSRLLRFRNLDPVVGRKANTLGTKFLHEDDTSTSDAERERRPKYRGMRHLER